VLHKQHVLCFVSSKITSDKKFVKSEIPIPIFEGILESSTETIRVFEKLPLPK
jgi:hypothetical protein